jgi:hypothetical protein
MVSLICLKRRSSIISATAASATQHVTLYSWRIESLAVRQPISRLTRLARCTPLIAKITSGCRLRHPGNTKIVAFPSKYSGRNAPPTRCRLSRLPSLRIGRLMLNFDWDRILNFSTAPFARISLAADLGALNGLLPRCWESRSFRSEWRASLSERYTRSLFCWSPRN